MTRPKHKLPDRTLRNNYGRENTYTHVLWAEINEDGMQAVNEFIQDAINCGEIYLSPLSTNWLPLYRNETDEDLYTVLMDNVNPPRGCAVVVYEHEIVSSCVPYVDPDRELWNKCCEIALAITHD